ncbi:MAG: hypothetical protein ACLTSX_03370 [Collinsella sp.]
MRAVDLAGILADAPAAGFHGASWAILGAIPCLDKARARSRCQELSARLCTSASSQRGYPRHGEGLRPSDARFWREARRRSSSRMPNPTAPEAWRSPAGRRWRPSRASPSPSRLDEIVRAYVRDDFAPYMRKRAQGRGGSGFQRALPPRLARSLQEGLGAHLRRGSAPQLAQRLAANMQQAFSVDGGAFARAIHFNMDAEDLASLMASYANASRLTYDNNLATLG